MKYNKNVENGVLYMNDKYNKQRRFKLNMIDVRKIGFYLVLTSSLMLPSCKKKETNVKYVPTNTSFNIEEMKGFKEIIVEQSELEVEIRAGKLVVRAPELLDQLKKITSTNYTSVEKSEGIQKEEENLDPNAIYYTVLEGDNISDIATNHNITITELEVLNNFKYEPIKAGQKIMVFKNDHMEKENKTSSLGDISKYGTFTVDGMILKDYNDALSQKWVEVIPEGEPVDMEIDLTKSYNYNDIEKILFNIAKYEGVTLYTIGKSVEGRNIYAINIDFREDIKIFNGEMMVSENIFNKEIILTTGQIHGREFAGCDFILKQLNDLIKQAQSDSYLKALLENTIFASIPCVNPDVRESIINGTSVPSIDGYAQKTNVNNVDLNRNFPSINAGQLAVGATKEEKFSTKPDTFFGGYTLGSEPETRAVMKWLNNFVPYANSILDYHQQGGGIYPNKGWDTSKNRNRYEKYAKEINKFLSKNAPITYQVFGEPYDGANAVGGSLTDYANSIATGMSWSTKYGRMVLLNKNNEELPLIVYYDLDKYKGEHIQINPTFVTGTLEIGRTREAYGNGKRARELRALEYSKHNFGKLLQYRAELALGTKRLEQIKNNLLTMDSKSISK